MTQRTSINIAVAAGLLLLAILAGLVGLLYTRPASAQTGATPGRQVTVVGHGEVSGKPDTATVQIGVETDGSDAKDALAQNSTQTEALIAKLKELGVAEGDLQTSNFSIYPNYDNEGRQVIGYHVSNTVQVTIRNLEGAGDLLDQVVQAGANRINGISFSIANTDAQLQQAREQAIKDAKSRAEQLAAASRATVGQTLVITENVGSVVPMPVAYADAARSVPLQAGTQNVTVDVQVTFELR